MVQATSLKVGCMQYSRGQGLLSNAGIGNQVSVEFNLLYRWHSAISRRDEDWSNRFFQELLQGDSRNPEDLTDEDLKEIFHKFKDAYSKDPSDWQIRDHDGKVIQRNGSGSLDDDALNALITNSTDDLAGKQSCLYPDRLALIRHRCIWSKKCSPLHEEHRNGRHQTGKKLECGFTK